MRKLLGLALLVLLTTVTMAQAQTDEPTAAQSWLFDGQVRTYQVHVPELLSAPAPLVIALHGRGDDGSSMENLTQFDTVADREGFMVAYPDGINNEWNFVRGVSGYDMTQDDTAFLVALIDHIGADYPVDKSRVYLAGFSNGALMVQRAACENPAPFAAFASVSGALFGGMPDVCPQTSTVRAPMLLINGTADDNIPWDGTSATNASGQAIYITYPISDTLGFWAQFNGCPLDADFTDIAPTGQSPDTQVRILTVKCPADTAVLLYRIAGGGHNWPGQQASNSQLFGSINRDIDASEEIWKFFAQHQRDDTEIPAATATAES